MLGTKVAGRDTEVRKGESRSGDLQYSASQPGTAAALAPRHLWQVRPFPCFMFLHNPLQADLVPITQQNARPPTAESSLCPVPQDNPRDTCDPLSTPSSTRSSISSLARQKAKWGQLADCCVTIAPWRTPPLQLCQPAALLQDFPIIVIEWNLIYCPHLAS